jgi:hypothetical protein
VSVGVSESTQLQLGKGWPGASAIAGSGADGNGSTQWNGFSSEGGPSPPAFTPRTSQVGVTSLLKEMGERSSVPSTSSFTTVCPATFTFTRYSVAPATPCHWKSGSCPSVVPMGSSNVGALVGGGGASGLRKVWYSISVRSPCPGVNSVLQASGLYSMKLWMGSPKPPGQVSRSSQSNAKVSSGGVSSTSSPSPVHENPSKVWSRPSQCPTSWQPMRPRL